MKRYLVMLLLFCFLLTGCEALWDGSYVSVTPHASPAVSNQSQSHISNYEQLYSAIQAMVRESIAYRSVTIRDYTKNDPKQDIEKVIEELTTGDPIANYSVENIEWQLSGASVLTIEISFSRTAVEMHNMQQVADMSGAEEALYTALNDCQTSLLLLVDSYTETDFVVLAENHAMRNPHLVMEMPAITANLYPSTGLQRVVELSFRYQSNRTMLRSMQSQVQPIFEAASLYVSGSAEDIVKYDQLYSFLMERYEYKWERSITPAYSLLCHGVGDSRAFASVYAAMCREAGLFCRVIAGTYQGQRHYWNMICNNGVYYHVDLLQGDFRTCTDEDMSDYVWDYSAYSSDGVHTQ